MYIHVLDNKCTCKDSKTSEIYITHGTCIWSIKLSNLSVSHVKRFIFEIPIMSKWCLSIKILTLIFPRWILLCFKREFPETDALKIWESCWSHYQTDYFHLFICVAIVSIYGDDVIDQGLPSDEILLHFSSLAMHMNGQLVLRKVSKHFLFSVKWYACTILYKRCL